MQQIEKSLTLLPLKDTDQPFLLSGLPFPNEATLLQHYLSEPHISINYTTVHLLLQGKKNNFFKYHPFVRNRLSDLQIWIQPNPIKSTNMHQLGWLLNHHLEHLSKSNIIYELATKLPNETHKTFQVNIRNVPYYPQKCTLTRAFMLEIKKDIATNHSESIFMLLGAVSDLTLAPTDSRMDMDNTIRQNFFFSK